MPGLGPGLGLRQRRPSLTIPQLLPAGMPTAYYDASVIGSLWKDVAGTDPVTAPGDLVARMDDLSGATHALQADITKRPVYSTEWGGRLLFDGVNDFLQSTATLDLTAADHANMIVAVRKLSDAAAGCALMFGTNVANGAMWINAPTGASASIRVNARGTVTAFANVLNQVAPLSAVIAGYADISDDATTMRVNAGTTIVAATDLGTGNFGNYAVTVGAFSAGTNPFNGYFQAGIILGGALADTERNAIEDVLRARLGV